MLRLLDTSGVDLVAEPPVTVTVRAQHDTGADYRITALIIENSGTLPVNSVQAALWWNDGTPAEYFSPTLSVNGTLAVDTHRILAPGEHTMRLVGLNYRAPIVDEAACNFSVTVLPRVQAVSTPRILYGPILPKDDGTPNAQQWNFNIGYDTEVLQSSLKMLLGTAKGERLMEPNYGTNLKKLLFSPMTQGIGDVARQEISDAISQWEPRVNLQSINVQKVSDRSISVYCDFVSKLTQNSFTVVNTFEV